MTTNSTTQLDRLRAARERLRPSGKTPRRVPTAADANSSNVLDRIAAKHPVKLCPVCMNNFIPVSESGCFDCHSSIPTSTDSHGKDV